MSESPKEQRILLPTSTSTMKVFMEAAQHQALLLALKVDELQFQVDELTKKLDIATIEDKAKK